MLGKLFGSKANKPAQATKPNFAKGDVEGFWSWFSANAGMLRQEVQAAERAPAFEEALNQIQDALQRINEGLEFELGIAEDKRLDLVISANGIKDVFPAVTSLVSAAPASADFKATAFRQRQPGGQIGISGRVLSADDLVYVSRQDGDDLDVWIFVPLPQDTAERDIKLFGFLLLDTVLGEYDVATALDGISFQLMSEAPEDTKPLSELAAEVDALSAGRPRH